jgi:hypothetical protein
LLGDVPSARLSLWKNDGLHRLIRLSFVCLLSYCLQAQNSAPRLLLSGRRLHRLKLDRGRHTERWNNFERRVETVPDSPERGLELALYGIVADDAASCKAAIQWGLGHRSEYRQIALIVDWCGSQLSDAGRTTLLSGEPAFLPAKPFRTARDLLFYQIVAGKASRAGVEEQWTHLLPLIQQDPLSCLPDLYALFEFLDAAHGNFRVDLRQDDPRLFSNLPLMFLLALHPAEIEHPDWKQRAGGLMMVSLDPNLQSASFVQGWALEDPKVVSDGPGVAYEFLLANPYLPGLGYYNMDLWVYDPPSSLLLARKSWDNDSCWVRISKGKTELLQCPPDVLEKPAQFGKLNLIPMKEQCLDVPAQSNGSVILSHLPPGRELAWEANAEKFKTRADAGGLALISSTVSGKVCQVNPKQ